jgi:hypothetical protein
MEYPICLSLLVTVIQYKTTNMGTLVRVPVGSVLVQGRPEKKTRERPSLECDEPPSLKHVSNSPLHLLEPHKGASLTLQVVKEPRQVDKLLPTFALRIRAMVHLFLVRRRVNMGV